MSPRGSPSWTSSRLCGLPVARLLGALLAMVETRVETAFVMYTFTAFAPCCPFPLTLSRPSLAVTVPEVEGDHLGARHGRRPSVWHLIGAGDISGEENPRR